MKVCSEVQDRGDSRKRQGSSQSRKRLPKCRTTEIRGSDKGHRNLGSAYRSAGPRRCEEAISTISKVNTLCPVISAKTRKYTYHDDAAASFRFVPSDLNSAISVNARIRRRSPHRTFFPAGRGKIKDTNFTNCPDSFPGHSHEWGRKTPIRGALDRHKTYQLLSNDRSTLDIDVVDKQL
ncbi:hypothetical protein P692DRAFT_201808369 [Suillus brevipes Sb2]|nr:hypothetical protein P692DRAFT_201808369 [Suillus brevipes Sb2]